MSGYLRYGVQNPSASITEALLDVTLNHHIWMRTPLLNEPWQWRRAHAISAGDQLSGIDGRRFDVVAAERHVATDDPYAKDQVANLRRSWATITTIIIDEEDFVFTLTVPETHVYYVGGEGVEVLVHNAS